MPRGTLGFEDDGSISIRAHEAAPIRLWARVLGALLAHEHDGATVRDVSGAIELSRTSAQNGLDTLERRGLAERVVGSSPRRWRATDDGARLAKRFPEIGDRSRWGRVDEERDRENLRRLVDFREVRGRMPTADEADAIGLHGRARHWIYKRGWAFHSSNKKIGGPLRITITDEGKRALKP